MKQHSLWLPVACYATLACLLVLTGRVSGQGLKIADDRLGGSARVAEILREWSSVSGEASSKWGSKAWQERRVSACSKSTLDKVCGHDVSSTEDKAALLLATSPSSYDTRIADNNGGFVAAPAPRDQYDCNACVAMAVAAAADAAVSKALARSFSEPFVSSRHLFFCNSDKTSPDCSLGWELHTALNELTKGSIMPVDRCLPFTKAEKLVSMLDDVICKPTCQDTVEGGRFSYTKKTPLKSMWKTQEHIRRYGGALSRMWVPNGFITFFRKPENRKAVWDKDDTKSDDGFNHAVVLVGYDNVAGHWLIWSSWGKDWGEGGIARVKFGLLDLADPRHTFGIVFSPAKPSGVAFGDLSNDAALPKGCQWYNVKRTTYLSNVAFDVGVPVEDIITLNADKLTDLGAWIKAGAKLKVCGAQPRPVAMAPLNAGAPKNGGAGRNTVSGEYRGSTQPSARPAGQRYTPEAPRGRAPGPQEIPVAFRAPDPIRRPVQIQPRAAGSGGRRAAAGGAEAGGGATAGGSAEGGGGGDGGGGGGSSGTSASSASDSKSLMSSDPGEAATITSGPDQTTGGGNPVDPAGGTQGSGSESSITSGAAGGSSSSGSTTTYNGHGQDASTASIASGADALGPSSQSAAAMWGVGTMDSTTAGITGSTGGTELGTSGGSATAELASGGDASITAGGGEASGGSTGGGGEIGGGDGGAPDSGGGDAGIGGGGGGGGYDGY